MYSQMHKGFLGSHRVYFVLLLVTLFEKELYRINIELAFYLDYVDAFSLCVDKVDYKITITVTERNYSF